MKTVCKTVYTFEELSEDARDKAREELQDINVYVDWWDDDYILEKWRGYGINANLKDLSFDIDRERYLYFYGKQGIWIESQTKLARAIYGKGYELLASRGLIEFYFETHRYSGGRGRNELCVLDNRINGVKELPANTDTWFSNLVEDYLSWLCKSYDYLTSQEAIDETIRGNSFYFTEDGKLYKYEIEGCIFIK